MIAIFNTTPSNLTERYSYNIPLCGFPNESRLITLKTKTRVFVTRARVIYYKRVHWIQRWKIKSDSEIFVRYHENTIIGNKIRKPFGIHRWEREKRGFTIVIWLFRSFTARSSRRLAFIIMFCCCYFFFFFFTATDFCSRL